MREIGKGWRKIVIDELTYHYRFGKQNVVIIPPKGKKYYVRYDKLTGKSLKELDKGGKYCGDYSYEIKPLDLKNYLIGMKYENKSV